MLGTAEARVKHIGRAADTPAVRSLKNRDSNRSQPAACKYRGYNPAISEDLQRGGEFQHPYSHVLYASAYVTRTVPPLEPQHT